MEKECPVMRTEGGNRRKPILESYGESGALDVTQLFGGGTCREGVISFYLFTNLGGVVAFHL